MSQERIVRALALCRRELRAAAAARNRSAVHYWALQVRDNQQRLRYCLERQYQTSRQQG